MIEDGSRTEYQFTELAQNESNNPHQTL